MNALSTRRQQIDKQTDGRVARLCWVIAQANGAKDAEIEDFMPKTEAELAAERQARFLAWVDKAVALSQAPEGTH
ncbi:MAG TPA: hypothetical protein PKN47_01565 [Nitrospira sp.]|nr:hypothetical protein [Nitrospira sp.]